MERKIKGQHDEGQQDRESPTDRKTSSGARASERTSENLPRGTLAMKTKSQKGNLSDVSGGLVTHLLGGRFSSRKVLVLLALIVLGRWGEGFGMPDDV